MTFATKFDLPPWQIHAVQLKHPGQWVHGDLNQGGYLFCGYKRLRENRGFREVWSSPQSYSLSRNKLHEERRAKYDHLYGTATTVPNLEIIATIYKCAFRLSRCLGIKHHVDHVIPICKGGSPHQQNMRVITGALNMKKNSKLNFPLPDEYQDSFHELSRAA